MYRKTELCETSTGKIRMVRPVLLDTPNTLGAIVGSARPVFFTRVQRRCADFVPKSGSQGRFENQRILEGRLGNAHIFEAVWKKEDAGGCFCVPYKTPFLLFVHFAFAATRQGQRMGQEMLVLVQWCCSRSFGNVFSNHGRNILRMQIHSNVRRVRFILRITWSCCLCWFCFKMLHPCARPNYFINPVLFRRTLVLCDARTI